MSMTESEMVDQAEDQEPEEDERKVTLSRRNIRALEDKAKRGDEADTLRRENALLRAGLELNEDQSAALLAVHKGEWTGDALRQTATSLGFIAAQPTGEAPDGPPLNEGEERSTTERQQLSNESVADTGTSEDPHDTAKREALAAMENGASFEDAVGVAFAHIAVAAQSGDRRAIYEPGD